jgi:hypothetical protein
MRKDLLKALFSNLSNLIYKQGKRKKASMSISLRVVSLMPDDLDRRQKQAAVIEKFSIDFSFKVFDGENGKLCHCV